MVLRLLFGFPFGLDGGETVSPSRLFCRERPSKPGFTCLSSGPLTCTRRPALAPSLPADSARTSLWLPSVNSSVSAKDSLLSRRAALCAQAEAPRPSSEPDVVCCSATVPSGRLLPSSFEHCVRALLISLASRTAFASEPRRPGCLGSGPESGMMCFCPSSCAEGLLSVEPRLPYSPDSDFRRSRLFTVILSMGLAISFMASLCRASASPASLKMCGCSGRSCSPISTSARAVVCSRSYSATSR
mmetsp:Transcript_99725/g.282454  ORF Transcript_99725/g.282454 Transcript_99725/m.282454 type:complete len:244 (-) Transcript_99725:161-892(-)